MRGWDNIFHANGKQKKSGVAILISDKIDLKIKNIKSDMEGHYIMIKGSIQEEDITIVNICAPNTGSPHYITQKLRDIKQRRQRHPTPVLLHGKSHGRRSLVGYNPWGCKESDTTE